MYFCGKKHPNAINTFLAWEEEKLARNALFYNFLIVLLNVDLHLRNGMVHHSCQKGVGHAEIVQVIGTVQSCMGVIDGIV